MGRDGFGRPIQRNEGGVMDSESVFWVAIWRTVAAAFCAFTLTCASCNVLQTRAIERMTKAGVHPIDARCGATNMSTAVEVCVARAVIKQ